MPNRIPAEGKYNFILLGFTRVDAPDPDADVQANIVYLNKGKNENLLRIPLKG